MRLAIVAGICIEHDAISAAAVQQAEMAASMQGVESVDVFAQHFDRRVGCPTHTVHDPWELLTHEAFEQADLAIFHFGVRYSIFDAIVAMDPNRQRSAVHFHNITPADLVAPKDRPAAEHSYRQILAPQTVGARYWYYSEFNRRTLIGSGIAESKMDFVPFPIEPPQPLRPCGGGETLELLSVGRMVRAKGIHTLIQAVAIARSAIERPIHLRLVGNIDLSDRGYVEEIIGLIDENDLEGVVTVLTDVDDDGLWRLYETADVVISASLHEGLCVPIIEGYLAGCRAIGTTEGNLPFVVQPPDPVVPPNDPEALADAIVAMSRDLRSGQNMRATSVRELCMRYSKESAARHMSIAMDDRLALGIEP